MEEDYKKLKQIIQEAVPEIMCKSETTSKQMGGEAKITILDDLSKLSEFKAHIILLGRPITLADVLLAIISLPEYDSFYWSDHDMTVVVTEMWNLKETLDNQSEETKKFLINLFVDKN